MEERENEREKNPGLFTGYANEYTIGRNSFSKENYTRNLEELILTRYIPLARRILNSKNQTIYEKIRHIRMLSNLLIENNTEKYRNIILGIVDKINFESVYDDEFRNRTIEDLNNNKKMLEFLLGIISQEKMINTFCEAIFNNEDNILEPDININLGTKYISMLIQKYNNIKESHFQNKSSILGLIFHYEKLFEINVENISKSNITRMTPELLKEIKQMDEYSNQAKFLAKYKINTEQGLFDFKKSAYDKINPLKSERENLWKKHKRAKTEAEKKSIENQIAEISKKITPLVEEIRHCDNIQSRIDKIKIYELHQKLKEERQKTEQQEKVKSKNKYRGR